MNYHHPKFAILISILIALSYSCSLQIFERSSTQASRQVASQGPCSLIKDEYEDLYQIQKHGEPLDPIWYDLSYAEKKLQDLATTSQCK